MVDILYNDTDGEVKWEWTVNRRMQHAMEKTERKGSIATNRKKELNRCEVIRFVSHLSVLCLA